MLTEFSDQQLRQGLDYLAFAGYSGLMRDLVEPEVPLALRLRALRSFVPLFEQVMAPRCSPHLSHLNELGQSPLNGICYMCWEIVPLISCPEDPARSEFDSEVLSVLRQLLMIPHVACRESALHGIGHWYDYPQLADVVDEFLACNENLRPEFVSYTEQAKVGNVQ